MRTSGGSYPASRHDSRKTKDFSIFRIFLGPTQLYESLRDLLGLSSAEAEFR
jgi:hypothetical protein